MKIWSQEAPGLELFMVFVKSTKILLIIHWATRRCGDVVTTPLSTSQQRRRYVSNETPNEVLMERR